MPPAERIAARPTISIDLVKQRLRLLQRLRALEIEYERVREVALGRETPAPKPLQPDLERSLDRLESEHLYQIRRLTDFDRVHPEIAPLFSIAASRGR